jgi:hypothetical protein
MLDRGSQTKRPMHPLMYVYIFLCTCAVLQKDTVFLLRLPLAALLVFKEITLHV